MSLWTPGLLVKYLEDGGFMSPPFLHCKVALGIHITAVAKLEERSSPVKFITTASLIFTFLFFFAVYAQSEEHYIYKDAQGKLVISNQQPPAGSNILRTLDLPEFREAQVQPVQEASSLRSTVRLESPTKQEQKK